MEILIALFIFFFSATIFGSRKQFRDNRLAVGSYSILFRHNLVPRNNILHRIVSQFLLKTGLIALYTLVSPRRRKIPRKKLRPNPTIAEVFELCEDIDGHPDNIAFAISVLKKIKSPLYWHMIYAREYYISEKANGTVSQKTWKNFVESITLFIGKALPDEAEPLLRELGKSGFLPASPILGDLYFQDGLWDKALNSVAKASEAGYLPAVHQHAFYIYSSTLGKLFQHRKMAECVRLFSQSADCGYPPSLLTMGEIYLNGYGFVTEPNAAEALGYLEVAYKAGEEQSLPLLLRARIAIGEQYFYE